MSTKKSQNAPSEGSKAAEAERDNNTGLNMLRTVNYLYRYASAAKPATITQISKNLGISNSIVTRLLTAELKFSPEIKLVIVYKHNGKFIEEDEYLALNSENPTEYPAKTKCRYFYIQNTWSTNEILTLTNAIDMIECVNPDAARSIIARLASYNDMTLSDKENDSDSFVREYPKYKYIGKNLATIHKAISASKRISFSYGKYNSHLMLVTKQLVKADPIAIMHYHSYYYLVAYDPAVNDIRHYRIERIVGKVSTITTDFSKLPVFETLKKIAAVPILSYTSRNVKMQGGKSARVTMVCSERIANNFVDAFGAPSNINPLQDIVHTEHYTITKHSPNDHAFHKEDGTFTVELRNVSIDGIVIWASQFCDDCEILAPDECRQRIRERISRANKRYSD